MTRAHPPWPQLLDNTANRMFVAAASPASLPDSPASFDAATPFLLHRRGPGLEVRTPPLHPAPDAALWWAIVGAPIDPDDVLDRASDPTRAGSLLRRDAYDTVEVWTEGELCALQALWWLANSRHRADWRRRVDTALRWHLEHTQPDNATNRPWAIAPFVHLGERENSPEAIFYAENLLHNASAGPARATTLIAEIIADNADALRTFPPG